MHKLLPSFTVTLATISAHAHMPKYKFQKNSVRMPSDVRILHIPKSQFASQVCGSLRSPIRSTSIVKEVYHVTKEQVNEIELALPVETGLTCLSAVSVSRLKSTLLQLLSPVQAKKPAANYPQSRDNHHVIFFQQL